MGNSRPVRRFQSVALLCLILIAGLVLMELGLRFVDTARGAVDRMRILAQGGAPPCAVIPNLYLTTTIGNQDIVVETNAMGMRWRQVERARSSAEPRIAFVGDSFTFGEWSPSTETSFVGVVDSHLRPQAVEVLNFGVPGDGPIEQEQRLVADILSFEPDYVVLNVFNGNDFSDTHLGLDKTDCKTGDVRQDLIRSKVPAAYLETPFQAFKRKLGHRSSLFRALHALKGRIMGDVRFAGGGNEEVRQTSLHVEDRFFAPAFWSRTDYPQIAISAKEEMIRTLGRIHDLSLAHDFKLILIAIPFREQVYTDAFKGEGYDLGLPQRYVAELAIERGISYYDLLPDFRRHVRDCKLATYVDGDPHFNELGHRLAGELIIRFLAGVLDIDAVSLPALACDLERLSGQI